MEYTENTAVGCVIMASGRAVRFGSNKLLADFGGAPLIAQALDASETPALAARVVVTRSPEVAELACKAGVKTILHSLPGRNDTVRLGSPVLFGSSYFGALCSLPEGKGGGVVIRQHPESVGAVYAARQEEPEDADTVEELERLRKLL